MNKGKRIFINKITGRLWLEDRIESGISILIDPYETEKDRQIPIEFLEDGGIYKLAWTTDEDWIKERMK